MRKLIIRVAVAVLALGAAGFAGWMYLSPSEARVEPATVKVERGDVSELIADQIVGGVAVQRGVAELVVGTGARPAAHENRRKAPVGRRARADREGIAER